MWPSINVTKYQCDHISLFPWPVWPYICCRRVVTSLWPGVTQPIKCKQHLNSPCYQIKLIIIIIYLINYNYNSINYNWLRNLPSETETEDCDIPSCIWNMDCFTGIGVQYRGKTATTEHGKNCNNWDSDFPHPHSYHPPEYSWAGVGDHRYLFIGEIYLINSAVIVFLLSWLSCYLIYTKLPLLLFNCSANFSLYLLWW